MFLDRLAVAHGDTYTLNHGASKSNAGPTMRADSAPVSSTPAGPGIRDGVGAGEGSFVPGWCILYTAQHSNSCIVSNTARPFGGSKLCVTVNQEPPGPTCRAALGTDAALRRTPGSLLASALAHLLLFLVSRQLVSARRRWLWIPDAGTKCCALHSAFL